MNDGIRPLGSRVLLRVLAEPATTASGIVLPDTAKEAPQRGEVVAVGDDEELIRVDVGDVVLYPKYTGSEVAVEGEEHLIMDAADLLAVVERAGVPA
jgi:chaperonin GroES